MLQMTPASAGVVGVVWMEIEGSVHRLDLFVWAVLIFIPSSSLIAKKNLVCL